VIEKFTIEGRDYEAETIKPNKPVLKKVLNKIATQLGASEKAFQQAVSSRLFNSSLSTLRSIDNKILGMSAVLPSMNGDIDLVGLFNPEGHLRGITGYRTAKADPLINLKNLATWPDEIIGELQDLRVLDDMLGFFGNPQPQFSMSYLNVIIQTTKQLCPEAKREDLNEAFAQSLGPVKAELDNWIKNNSADFVARAHLEAVDALKLANQISAEAYRFYAVDDETREPRLQAAEAIPFLAGEFATKFTFRRTIDKKESVYGATTSVYKIGKKAGKRLRNIHWRPTGTTPESVIQRLMEIDSNWIPNSAESWTAFLEVSEFLHGQLVNILGTEKPEILYQGCKGKWEEFALRLRKAAGITDENEKPVPKAIGDGALAIFGPAIDHSIKDYADRIITPLVTLAAFGGNDTERLSSNDLSKIEMLAAKMLYDGLGSTEILDKVRRFQHHRTGLMGTAVERENKKSFLTFWPPLTGNFTTPDGVVVRELVTPSELREEGKTMRHCVGGYSRKCVQGHSRIYSLQDGEDKRSTLEIRTNVTNFQIVQNMSKRNQKPPPSLQYAAQWILTSLCDGGSLKHNMDAIREHAKQANIEASGNRVQVMCGYDWSNLNNIEEAYAAGWQDHMTKNYAVNIESMLKMDEVRKVIKSINRYADIEYNIARPARLAI